MRINNTVNDASFFMQSNSKLEIENRDHPWLYFDAINLTMTLDLAKGYSFKIVFQGNPWNVIFKEKKISFYASRAQFWNPNILINSFQCVEFNFDLKFFIWLINKKSTFANWPNQLKNPFESLRTVQNQWRPPQGSK